MQSGGCHNPLVQPEREIAGEAFFVDKRNGEAKRVDFWSWN